MAGPWLKFAANTHADGKLRRAKARTIWPWVLCRLKDGDGYIDGPDLDPGLCSQDHDGDVSLDQCAEKFDALKAVGLLVEEGGRWTTPGWRRYQSDPTNKERQANHRARKSADKPAAVSGERYVTASNGDVTSRNGRSPLVTPEENRIEETIGDETQQQPRARACARDRTPPAAAAAAPEGEEIKPHVHTGEVFVEAPQLPQPSPEDWGQMQGAWGAAFGEVPDPHAVKLMLRWWRQTDGDIARIRFALAKSAAAGKEGAREVDRYASVIVTSASRDEVNGQNLGSGYSRDRPRPGKGSVGGINEEWARRRPQ